MANTIRQVEPSNKRQTHILQAAVMTLFALYAPFAVAQERRSSMPASDRGISGLPAVEVITLGTTKEKVDSILGPPRSGSTINCLGRSLYSYPDGTKIVFVDGCALSATAGGLALGNPGQGYTIKHEGRQVFLEPAVLHGVPIDGPMGEIKQQLEECFFFGPPTPGVSFEPLPPWRSSGHDFMPLRKIRPYGSP